MTSVFEAVRAIEEKLKAEKGENYTPSKPKVVEKTVLAAAEKFEGILKHKDVVESAVVEEKVIQPVSQTAEMSPAASDDSGEDEISQSEDSAPTTTALQFDTPTKATRPNGETKSAKKSKKTTNKTNNNTTPNSKKSKKKW